MTMLGALGGVTVIGMLVGWRCSPWVSVGMWLGYVALAAVSEFSIL